MRPCSLRRPLEGQARSLGRRYARSMSQSRQHATATSLADSRPMRPVSRVYPPIGQPTPSSHPQLFSEGELTPGVQAKEYEQRRQRLIDSLPDGSVCISASAPVAYMSQKIFYKYRQATDFYYLTGFQEANSAVVLEKDPSCKRGFRMSLFVAPKDIEEELWNGTRTGVTAAVDVFDADEAFDIGQLENRLETILARTSGPIYCDTPEKATRTRAGLFTRSAASQAVMDFLYRGKSASYPAAAESSPILQVLAGMRGSRQIRPLCDRVEQFRLYKSSAEVRLMRQAAELSCEAHAKVMRRAQPGINQAALVAEFEYYTASKGAERLAYVPVCASGQAALTIHYTANDRPLEEGSLVLFDAGCEYQGYASDITRTFPVDGRFTGPQADLYQAVLNVEKACVDLCTEDNNMTLSDLHARSCQLLRSELSQLGFSFGSNELSRLYPHFIGHCLGQDLHDTLSWDRHQKIKAGIVLTIEPGIYVPAHASFPQHFHGLGIRVEDEVLVERSHSVNLSANGPKEIVDVEAACLGLLEPV
ncbi:uncharacterized protein L969DRAFT_96259 [Mixia osmundae IAM 14324]|uniref:Aminopeptidase P N-terminal domain-containing protein n=1 Tax=Mixia osmundae (strain CBS 9802 / IAM 14324 / JCM 22182 / KY 12970) TaxID=764103 RepID=G7E4W9_MIXOS|nr:uncharacterized protein L969DRAFT_96259 [Mixia osmundae IAM 14324]KEI37741.1 hypothetical protein L969DRAFT_96259 [Mixia osmundae IAM 14324]GAA97879.1 hypothetical protein E5Q_04559 [Mixia osmundae IAM 14324]